MLPEVPFLQGRGFVFASQFAKLLPAELAGQYLEAALRVIEGDDGGIPVKISAVKSVLKYVLCLLYWLCIDIGLKFQSRFCIWSSASIHEPDRQRLGSFLTEH